jgi:Secretion system C-terminal sorting domain
LYLAGNKIRFVTLKRLLIILSIILFSAAAGTAQVNRTSNSGIKVVRFYPNPAASFINFEFQTPTNLSNYSFKIYNFIGKKIAEINNITPRTVVNLTDYFRGVYIFQLTDRSGQIVESGKFQVVK